MVKEQTVKEQADKILANQCQHEELMEVDENVCVTKLMYGKIIGNQPDGYMEISRKKRIHTSVLLFFDGTQGVYKISLL